MNLDYLETDREVYERELAAFMPERMFDVHSHIGLAEHFSPISERRYREFWALQCGHTNSFEEMQALYRRCFPGKQVSFLCFPLPIREAILPECHRYISEGRCQAQTAHALCAAVPGATRTELVDLLVRGDFIGFKPYPDLVLDKPWESEDVFVEDYVSEDLLRLADDYGLILMLHLGREERMADPHNISAVKRIASEHPRIGLIIAHLGRSYCPGYAEKGLAELEGLGNIHFDLSAVINPDSIAVGLRRVGAGRLHFGMDLPLTTYHGRLICREGRRVIYAREKFEWNEAHEPEEVEKRYVPAFYELIRCIKKACFEVGSGREEIEDIFFNNSRRIVEKAEEGLKRLKEDCGGAIEGAWTKKSKGESA